MDITKYVTEFKQFPITVDQHDSLSEYRNIINKNFRTFYDILTKIDIFDFDFGIINPQENDIYVVKYLNGKYSFVKQVIGGGSNGTFSGLADFKFDLPIDVANSFSIRYSNTLSKWYLEPIKHKFDELSDVNIQNDVDNSDMSISYNPTTLKYDVKPTPVGIKYVIDKSIVIKNGYQYIVKDHLFINANVSVQVEPDGELVIL